jgi:hypothetical protein
MILTDNSTNTEFLYVYVSSFKWENPFDHESKGGHPMPGKVYRAVKNKDAGTYRLFVSSTTPPMLLVFTGLEEAIEGAYTSNIKPITIQNLLDFDISDGDLDSLLDWLKTGNSELKKVLNFRPPLILSEPVNQPAMIQKPNDEVEDFIRCAQQLHELNPNLLDSLHNYIHFAIEEEENFEGGPLDTTFLTLSKDHGTGANIVQAVQKLSRYASSNRKENLDEADLFGAITNLLNERTNQLFNK